MNSKCVGRDMRSLLAFCHDFNSLIGYCPLLRQFSCLVSTVFLLILFFLICCVNYLLLYTYIARNAMA